MDKTYTNGVFSIDIDLMNYRLANESGSLTVSIVDKKGAEIYSKKQNWKANAGQKTKLSIAPSVVKNPVKWSAESPELYTLVLTLSDNKGNLLEATSCKIGFRSVELKNSQLLVNGKAVLLKGVNLHEHSDKTGHLLIKPQC